MLPTKLKMSSKTVLQKMLHAREGAHVTRFHTFPIVNPQQASVGLHTNNMLQMMFLLIDEKHITPALTRFILFHDSAFESITSDISGGAKIEWPILKTVLSKIEEQINATWRLMPKTFTADEAKICKALDMLELYIFLLEQSSMGNNSKMVRELLPDARRYTIERMHGVKHLTSFSGDDIDRVMRINIFVSKLLFEITGKT